MGSCNTSKQSGASNFPITYALWFSCELAIPQILPIQIPLLYFHVFFFQWKVEIGRVGSSSSIRLSQWLSKEGATPLKGQKKVSPAFGRGSPPMTPPR